MGKALKLIGAILLVVLILAVVAFAASLTAIFICDKTDIVGDPKVMVIFGYQMSSDEVPPLMKTRLDAALAYLNEHPDMTVIVSGGNAAEGRRSEAECMRDYLVANGVSEDSVLLEDRSATTVENIKFTLELIEARGVDASDGVLLVSNDFHLARIKMLFKRAGSPYTASVLSARSEPLKDRAAMHLRETFVLAFSFLSDRF